MEAFTNLLDPFHPSVDKNKLYMISSGAAVPSDIETHLLNAEKQGAQARSDVIEEGLKAGEHFFEPINMFPNIIR